MREPTGIVRKRVAAPRDLSESNVSVPYREESIQNATVVVYERSLSKKKKSSEGAEEERKNEKIASRDALWPFF
jgi:hypothetical protein